MTDEAKSKQDGIEIKLKEDNSKPEAQKKMEETKKTEAKTVSAAGGDSDKKKSSYDDEHTISLEQLEEEILKTDFNAGLTKSEAGERLEKFGPNSLTPPHKTPEWIKFLKTMFTGFALLLWVAAILCFLAYGIDSSKGDPSPDNLYVGGAITFVVVVSCLSTFYQENKSSKIMESFAKMIPPKGQSSQGRQGH